MNTEREREREKGPELNRKKILHLLLLRQTVLTIILQPTRNRKNYIYRTGLVFPLRESKAKKCTLLQRLIFTLYYVPDTQFPASIFVSPRKKTSQYRISVEITFFFLIFIHFLWEQKTALFTSHQLLKPRALQLRLEKSGFAIDQTPAKRISWEVKRIRPNKTAARSSSSSSWLTMRQQSIFCVCVLVPRKTGTLYVVDFFFFL